MTASILSTRSLPPFSKNQLPSAAPLYLAVALTSVVFLYLRTFLLPAIPFVADGDELLFFSRALRILHGQVLYRDTFELVPPGTEWLYVAGFRVFGVHSWLIAAWHILLGTGVCLVMTSIARRILTGMAVLLPALLFLAFDLSSAMDATHHWWSTLSALCAVAILMGDGGSWRIASSSLFCALSTLFTQTQGVLVFLAITLYLSLEARHSRHRLWARLMLHTLLYVTLIGAALGYCCATAGVKPVFHDLLVLPFTGLSGPMNSPSTYLRLFPHVAGVADLPRLLPFFIICGLTPYIYLVSLYLICIRRRFVFKDLASSHLLLLNMVGLALFIAISSGPRFFRICTVAPPAFLVLIWHLQQAGGRLRFIRAMIWGCGLLFLLWLPWHRQHQWHRVLDLPIGNSALRDYGRSQEWIWLGAHTSAGDTMFNDVDTVFYLGLTNPMQTEFVNNDDLTSAGDIETILTRIRAKPPKYIAFDPDIPLTPHDHAEPFRAYLRQHYYIEKRFVIGPNGFTQELWVAPMTTSAGP